MLPILSRVRLSFGWSVMASTVVAHDGGVRLICAGWVPQDDDSIRSRARPLRTRASEQHRSNEIACGTEYCVILPRGVASGFQQQEVKTLAKWAYRETTGANQPHRPARRRWESNPSRPRGSSQRDERLHAQGRDGESAPECRRSCQAQQRHPVRVAFGAPDPFIELGDPATDLVRTGMAPRIRHHRAAVCLPLVLLRSPPGHRLPPT
jgi:hypothetical protein